MKIAVLIDRMNVGGVEKIAIEQVNALRNLGEEAYLVILRRKGVVDNAFLDLRKDLPTIYLDDRLPRILRFSFKFPVFYFFSSFHITYPFLIPWVVKQKEFDYILSHGTYTTLTTIFIKKSTGIPYSVFLWDPIVYILDRVYQNRFLQIISLSLRTIALYLDKQILENADEVLVGGDAHNTYFKKIAPEVKIRLIPPAMHPVATIVKNKEKSVLMVTAWKKAKNPEYIFQIIKKIPTIHINMVGKWLDPLYEKSFKELVRKSYSRNITLVGAVSEKQLSHYYKSSLVLLQTNDDRGFGMPALEAGGSGTTFIIPEGQGVCRAFKDTVDGFFTKERDTKKIVSYLQMLLKNEKKAKEMGKSAWNRIKDTYSWKAHAKILIDLALKYKKSEKNDERKKSLVLPISFVFLLVVINVCVHHVWFDPRAIVSNGDWMYLFPEALRSIHWSSWMSLPTIDSAFGSPNFLPLRFLMSVVGNTIALLGFNQQVMDMLLFFLPIALIGPIAIYLLLFRLTNSPIGSFLGSFFYLFNSYILVWSAAGYPLVFVYFLAPLVLLLFDLVLTRITFLSITSFVLVLSLCIFFDLRLAVLLCLFLSVYSFYTIFVLRIRKNPIQNSRKFWLLTGVFIILFISINFYLFVFSLSESIQNVVGSTITNRVLIKPGYFFLSNAFTSFYPFWTNGQPTMFFMQVTPWYFWIIPPYVFFSALFLRKEKLIGMFLVLTVLLIFLGKGPTPPLANFYEWAYMTLPIFNFFRESSKFWQLLLLLFSVLVAFSFTYIFVTIDRIFLNKKYVSFLLKCVFILPFLSLLLFTLLPVITSKIGAGYISYRIPREYIDLKDFLVSKKNYFRVLQIPTYSRFVFFDEIHPHVAYNQIPQHIRTLSPYILRLLTIQYLLVPIDPYYEVFPGNSDRNTYESAVKEAYSKKIPFGSLTVYKNPLPAVPHVYAIDTLNTIKGSITTIDDVFFHLKNKNDFYITPKEDISKTDEVTRIIKNQVNEKVLVSSCISCKEFVASDTAKMEDITLKKGEYQIYIKKHGFSSLQLYIDEQHYNLDINDNWYFLDSLFLSSGKHRIKIVYERENLVNIGDGSKIHSIKEAKSITLTKDNLRNNTPYKISFDYKIPFGVETILKIKQNTDFYFQYQQGIYGGPSWHAFDGPLNTNNEWNTFEATFSTIFNAKTIRLDFQERAKNNKNMQIKNIKLTSNNKPQVLLYTQMKNTRNTSLPKLTFREVNPTKYRVYIEDAKTPFLLIFAEQFNTFWQASLISNNGDNEQRNGMQVSPKVYEIPYESNYDIQSLFSPQKYIKTFDSHFMINEFANAWYIDKKGNYTIEISFLPERDFVLSLVTSFISFTACIILVGVLVYGNLYRKK